MKAKSTNIPFNLPGTAGPEFAYLRQAIEAHRLSGDGSFSRRCESLIRRVTTSPKALLTHSCTAALEMAAILCDLGPGDEVIMPSFTFVSTANAVVLRGAVPVFVDIEPRTLMLDPERVADAVGPRTKAIFAVHYAGFPADMDTLAAVARRHDLVLVEDAAQAIGSTYRGRPCGSLGDMAAFSFHETKNVVSGEGGALTVNRPDMIERAEIIREKGTDRSRFHRGQVDKYTWVDVGSSYLPSELVAAYLCAQLEAEADIRAQRLALFDRYREAFTDLESIGRVRLPVMPPDCTGNGHMFYLLMRDAGDLDAFIAHMKAADIATPFHYVPLHSAPAGLRFGRAHGVMDVTEQTAATLVRLPMYLGLERDIDFVIEAALIYLTTDRAGCSG